MNPALRAGLPILIGASVMLSLAMGLRQSLGLFMAPATRDLGVAVAEFTLAIAVQNLGWGLLQPFAGAAAARWGFRPVLMVGVVAYLAGLALMAMAQGAVALMIGAGVLIGVSLACTGGGMAMAVAARPVPPAFRSTALGIVSAAGSVGALIAAPIGQVLSEGWGWRAGVWGFLLTTHLPSYLEICGQDPMLSAKALGTIGGFNMLGSLFFGWAGGRWNKGVLLGGIYLTRSLTLGLYFAWPPSEVSTLVFAAVIGFLWLGVAPLVSGMAWR